MANDVITAALLFGLAFIITRSIVQHVLARYFMSRTGCLLAPAIDGGFLGARAARESTAALERGEYLALSRARYAAAGNTYQGIQAGQAFLATIDHENLKAIFTRPSDFVSHGRKTDWWPLLRGGILVADGTEWKNSRALLRPTFAKTQLTDFDKLETHVSRLVSQVPKEGGTVELQKLFSDLTMFSGLDYLLGHSGETEYEQLQKERFAENLRVGVFEAGRRAKIGIFRLLDPIIRPYKYVRYLLICGELQGYIDRIIDRRLSAKKGGEARAGGDETEKEEEFGKKEKYVFLDHLAQATQDRKQLRWELGSTLAAAGDTTAGLLGHIFWVLARRPDIWRRLQQEVDELGGKRPDHESLQKLIYIKAVMFESLRMYPNIGIMFRWAARDTTLPVGGGPDGRSPCFVPAGRRIATSFNALHRRRDVWGPDADEFRPERWLVDDDGGEDDVASEPRGGEEKTGAGGGARRRRRLRSMPEWTYLPFGAGSRICPGRNFAQVEAQYTIVRVMQEFRRIESRDERPYAEEAGITIMLKHGAFVGLFPA